MLKGVSATRRNPVYPALGGEPPYRLLTGLGAEGVTAVLGQRVRDAQEGGERVMNRPARPG